MSRKLRNPIDRFIEKIDKNGPTPEHQPHLGPCWQWTAYCKTNGYGQFRVSRPTSPVYAHRFAYEHFIAPLSENLVVMHLCDNPKCCNPTHLATGSHADNVADKISKNRQSRGTDNGRSKLTDSDVLRILQLLAEGRTRLSIAREYSVDCKAIYSIEHGTTWKHIPRI